MKEYLKWIIGGIVAVVAITALSIGIKYFAQPMSRSIDQKTFMESQQYVDGSVRDLSKYQVQYTVGDDATKAMIRSTVQHQFANFPSEKVPLHLQPFYSSMMSGGDLK
ncbi:MAG: hypothetical protein PHI47_06395 [Sulfuricurvum sp.]|uniref:hypothetical protein n=1 Tax=Sulfuricurvum sp. TaxID=2025608 RepID=UPI00261B6BCA|nr:hypothetical protein [Sulfuricurvum sp.]MDD5159663.1 hypothetical protein [Sulfuricurvum sp.]